MKEKLYKCKFCGERKPLSEIQVRMPYVCRACIPLYFEENKEKVLKKAASDVRKKERQRLNKKKEELMTLSDWLKIAQRYFNKFIRLRDKDEPCISCGAYVKGASGHASHFKAVGSAPSLRFDEGNCFKSCVQCNYFKGGHLAEYRRRLIEKVGIEEVERLDRQANEPLQLTIPEVKELIEHYKGKIKELEKE